MNKAGLAIGVAAAILVIGGCGKKVGGQVVAVVNGQEITQGELNAELNGQQIPPNADKKAAMAQLLQQIINRKLLIGKAKEQGLDKSPAYLAQVQRAQDAVLINMLVAAINKKIAVPSSAAADTFMTQNTSMFAGRKRYQLDQLAFPMTPDPALAAKLKAAKTMAEVETVLKDAGIQYQKGAGQLDTAAIPPGIATQIAALPPGMPFIVPQNGQVVVSVIKSAEALPVPAAQGQPAAVELLRRQAVDKAVRDQVDSARSSAKITYGAGYGPPAKPAKSPAGTTPPAS